MSRPEKHDSHERLQAADGHRARVGVVSEDHAILGARQLQQEGILGPDQTLLLNVEDIKASRPQGGDDAGMNILIREQGELMQLQGATSAEITTSFSRNRAA